MDTSHWTKLRVKVVRTQKKFFGKYLYKIKILAPGGRLTDKSLYPDLKQGLARRQSHIKTISEVNSRWSQRLLMQINQADISQLEYLQTVKENNPQLCFRIEEPHVSVYAENEEDLVKLAQGLPDIHKVVQINRPFNQESVEALNRGEVLTRKPQKFDYKIVFKEHRIQDRSRLTQIYNYLDSLGGEEIGRAHV